MEQIQVYDSLFKEVGKNQLKLSLSEQYDLLVKYHEFFDEKYSDLIVRANLKLIMGICKRFLRHKTQDHPMYMDVHSEAFKEAVNCLKRFRFDKGNCTVPSWIRNNVHRKISNFMKTNKYCIKYTPIVHDRLDLYGKAKNAFYTKNERLPMAGDSVDFLYKGRREFYEFKKDYDTPIFLAETQAFKGADGDVETSIFDIIQKEDENQLYMEDEKHKKELFKNIIDTLPYRQKQIMNLLYYEGVKVMDINKKITPLTEKELLKAEKHSNNRLCFIIDGKEHVLDVFVADYKIIDVQPRHKPYSFLLNGKYYTNSERLCFSLPENIDIKYDDNIYKGEKKGEMYHYEIFLTKKMNPAIVRMTVDIEHRNALYNLKKHILKNNLLSGIRPV